MIRCEPFQREIGCFLLVGWLQLVLPFGIADAADNFSRLWPAQARPAGLVGILSKGFQNSSVDDRTGNLGDEAMLAQSLAGLAALAVNEGQGDELVYIDLWDNYSYQQWRSHLLQRTGIEDRGNASVWELVSRYHKQGIVAGYILYSDQTTKAQANASANVATSLAGVLRGVVISERQEATAKQLGLTMLLDARDKSEAWCFENYQDRLSRKQLLLQRYRIPNNRAIAIAHQSLIIRGDGELAERVYEWLEAPALVHGWNGAQDEGSSVRQISRWGHVLCPSDWATNLPALSVGSEGLAIPRFEDSQSRPSNGPTAQNPEQQLAFVLTDGDNLQWVLGDFAWNESFWAASELEETPFGFGLPIADLLDVAPDAYLYFQKTKPKSTSILVAPSYVYMDHLGVKLPKSKRSELLRWYAQYVESVLQRAGLSSIILICDDLEHSRTQEAWQVLASEAPSLSTVFVLQYHPYEAGNGRVWNFDRPGHTRLRVISAAYSLWSNANRPRAGTPGELAQLIEQSVQQLPQQSGLPRSFWVAVHAWSKFPKSVPGNRTNRVGEHACAGAGAAMACAQSLGGKATVVSPRELMTTLSTSKEPRSSCRLIQPSRILASETQADGRAIP